MDRKETAIGSLQIAPKLARRLVAQGINTVEMFLAQAARPGGEGDLGRLLGLEAGELRKLADEARGLVRPEFLELLSCPVRKHRMGVRLESRPLPPATAVVNGDAAGEGQPVAAPDDRLAGGDQTREGR